jgi:hypothetical protein
LPQPLRVSLVVISVIITLIQEVRYRFLLFLSDRRHCEACWDARKISTPPNRTVPNSEPVVKHWIYGKWNTLTPDKQSSKGRIRAVEFNVFMAALSSPLESLRMNSSPLTPPERTFSRLHPAGSSWMLYRRRVWNGIFSTRFRTAAAFFLFGLLNNILYVIILSENTRF